MASLLGTGVTLERCFGVGLELECVFSLRCRGSSFFMADATTLVEGEEAGPFALAAPEDLAKKPKMLCCLPVDTVTAFFAADTALAGVRAGAAGFSAMTTGWMDGEVVESKEVQQSQQHIQGRMRETKKGGREGRGRRQSCQAYNHFKGDTGDAKSKDGSRVQRVCPKKKEWCLRQVSRMRVARECGG